MKKIFLLFACFEMGQLTQAQTSIAGLTVEKLVNPVGIDMTAPRFSWKLLSKVSNR